MRTVLTELCSELEGAMKSRAVQQQQQQQNMTLQCSECYTDAPACVSETLPAAVHLPKDLRSRFGKYPGCTYRYASQTAAPRLLWASQACQVQIWNCSRACGAQHSLLPCTLHQLALQS